MPTTNSIAPRRRRFIYATLTAFCLLASAGPAAPATSEAAAFDLDHYRGKVVVLDFWASWCKPCRQSIPWLNEMRSRYGEQGLVIIGVNVDANREDAERFLKETPIDFDVVFGPQGTLAQRHALKGMPSTFVFDRDGKLVATHLGFQQAKTNAREAALKLLIDKAGS